MQIEFGKDVLGVVKLEKARNHNDKVIQFGEEESPKTEIKEEKRLYSEVKKARWILFTGETNLFDDETSSKKKILGEHTDLAM